MGNLDHKNIIIFGATGFIGQNLTTTLANTGTRLIIHGKTQEKVNKLYKSTSSKNNSIISFCSDVLSEKFYLELFKTVSSHFDHIDVMINLIGKFNGLKSITDLSHRDWNDLMEINFSCYWRIIKELNSIMGGKKKTKIIFLTTKKIGKGKAYHHTLGLSKSCLYSLVNTLNDEKKKLGFETNLIEAEQLNIGITSLLRGQNSFKKKDLDTIIKKIMEKF
jgi:NADP-dependent 3-hydroxy acid dehydrogenase YdfG